jgi:hypothetical protein
MRSVLLTEEFLLQSLVGLDGADDDQHDAGKADEPAPSGPAEHSGRGMTWLLGLVRAAAGQNAGGDGKEPEVGDASGEVPQPLARAISSAALRSRANGGERELPERIREQAEGNRNERDLAQRRLRERRERSLLVGSRAAGTQRQCQRQSADDAVGDPARDEPTPHGPQKGPCLL